MARVGGRPRQVRSEDIVRVGRELGLERLSMHAVAERLGVTATALYRHVEGRWGLERLVGESFLADIELEDDPAHSTERHLLSFGMQLRAAILASPGLAGYVQTLFPRGENGRRLLATEVEALGRRGYDADAAIVLAAAVASVAIGFAAAEETRRQHREGLSSQQLAAEAQLLADTALGPAVRSLPDVGDDDYVRLWLGAAVRGFVASAPPGSSAHQIRAALDAAEKEQ